jgi:hypothetical protein
MDQREAATPVAWASASVGYRAEAHWRAHAAIAETPATAPKLSDASVDLVRCLLLCLARSSTHRPGGPGTPIGLAPIRQQPAGRRSNAPTPCRSRSAAADPFARIAAEQRGPLPHRVRHPRRSHCTPSGRDSDLGAGEPDELTTYQSRRSMMVALAKPPPSHMTCRP